MTNNRRAVGSAGRAPVQPPPTDPNGDSDGALAARRRAVRRGHLGETLAAWYLRAKGYRIIAARFRVKAGEIDLVARRGRWIVFVEVKTRSKLAADDDPVTAASVRRIEAAADVFLARHPRLEPLDRRFDLVLVAPWRWPRHLVGRL